MTFDIAALGLDEWEEREPAGLVVGRRGLGGSRAAEPPG